MLPNFPWKQKSQCLHSLCSWSGKQKACSVRTVGGLGNSCDRVLKGMACVHNVLLLICMPFEVLMSLWWGWRQRGSCLGPGPGLAGHGCLLLDLQARGTSQESPGSKFSSQWPLRGMLSFVLSCKPDGSLNLHVCLSDWLTVRILVLLTLCSTEHAFAIFAWCGCAGIEVNISTELSVERQMDFSPWCWPCLVTHM